jgi:hypothetical protein
MTLKNLKQMAYIPIPVPTAKGIAAGKGRNINTARAARAHRVAANKIFRMNL